MLSIARREHQSTLEKTYSHGRIPQNPEQGKNTIWKTYNAVPLSKEDTKQVQTLVATYVESSLKLENLQETAQIIAKEREEIAIQKNEIRRTAVKGILTRIFKINEENLLSIFSQEKLDKLGFQHKRITIESDGMSEVIVAYLKTHSLPALDLRSFDLQNGALESLFKAIPETDVRSICLSRQMTPEELSSKEATEKTLSGLGRTLRIVIK